MTEVKVWELLIQNITTEFNSLKGKGTYDQNVKVLAKRLTENTNFALSYQAPNEEREFAQKVMDRMNLLKGGKKFPFRYPSYTASQIMLRKKEYDLTLEDFYEVLATMWERWRHRSDTITYFRPNTIFRKTKFPNYLGADKDAKRKSGRNTTSPFELFAGEVENAQERMVSPGGNS